MTVKQAVVFTGGVGAKLRPLTLTTPKPLLPLLNKPILDYVIHLLKSAFISEIIFVTDYLSDRIESYLNVNDFGISIKVHTPKHYQGSARMLLELSPQLDPHFLVIPGDCIVDINLNEIVACFSEQKSDLGLIVRKQKDPLQKGWLCVQSDTLIDIVSKKSAGSKIDFFSDAWIYFMKKAALMPLIPKDRYFDIHIDLILSSIKNKLKIDMTLMKQYWSILGRIPPYLDTNFWILKNIGNQSYIGAHTQISARAKLTPPFFIEEGCVIEDGVKLGPNVILGKNSIIKENSDIAQSVIDHDVTIGSDNYIRKAVIAGNCAIGNICKLGRFVVLGENTMIKDGCELKDAVRVGPQITLEPGTIVSDFIFPEGLSVDTVSLFCKDSMSLL